MSRSAAIVVFVIALLGGAVAYVLVERDDRENWNAPAGASNGPAASEPARPQESVRDVAPQADDTSIDESQSDYERMKDEFVSVLGGHRLDQECVRETRYRVDPETGATTASDVSNCTPTKPPHPYRSYSTEALESLAYSDPVAAALLGQRMWENSDNIHATVDMMMRATALSNGQWVHLQWLTAQRFSGISVNGVPDVQSIHARYVLETVMDNFRTDGARRDQWYADIRETYVIPESEIERLEHTADLYMQRIRQIQRDVMGLTDMEVDEHAQTTITIP